MVSSVIFLLLFEIFMVGAKIESNVKMTQSIICDGAIVKSGATISRGCIIAKDVI